jgi:putative hydrolase of the HAD superfamily
VKLLADLFFDLDRTLWDFDRNSREALRGLFRDLKVADLTREAGEEVDEATFIRAYEFENERLWAAYRKGELTKAELRPIRFHKALVRCGVNSQAVPPGWADEAGTAYVERSPRIPHLIPGAIEAVMSLREQGHRMFILTNGFEEFQAIKMECSGLNPFFDAVFTSDALGVKKPDRRIFDAVLQATGSRADRAIMIGDDLECDVVGAREAGWRQVYYNRHARSNKEQVWRTVTNFEQLLKIPLEA